MLAVAVPPDAGPNSEGCMCLFDSLRALRLADYRAFGRRWGRDVVEDALTAVALDDAVVVAYLLKDRRAQAHVAHRAQAVPGGGRDRDAFPDARHLFERGDQPRFD